MICTYCDLETEPEARFHEKGMCPRTKWKLCTNCNWKIENHFWWKKYCKKCKGKLIIIYENQ